MILSFTKAGIEDTALLDAEGKVIYQTHTAFKSPFRLMTSIHRGPINPENTGSELQIEHLQAGEDEQPMSNSSEIARIHWHLFHKARIVYGTKITDDDKIFQEAGTGFFKLSFAFTGPDGKPYIWDLGKHGTDPGVLKSNDDSKTVIAKLHRKVWSLTGKKRLEIFSTDVLDWLDFLIVTFVYTESMRVSRETA